MMICAAWEASSCFRATWNTSVIPVFCRHIQHCDFSSAHMSGKFVAEDVMSKLVYDFQSSYYEWTFCTLHLM